MNPEQRKELFSNLKSLGYSTEEVSNIVSEVLKILGEQK